MRLSPYPLIRLLYDNMLRSTPDKKTSLSVDVTTEHKHEIRGTVNNLLALPILTNLKTGTLHPTSVPTPEDARPSPREFRVQG